MSPALISRWMRKGRFEMVRNMAHEPTNKQSAGSTDVARQFLVLLEPHKESIARYALRNAWNREQAQDIVQEAVMTAWREYHRFEQGTDFRAWIFRILVNTIYSFNKKTSRENRHSSSIPIEDRDDVLQRNNAWSSVLEEPERILESLDDRLVSAIAKLSTDERQCLMLRLLEGFSYKEISAFLCKPMGTVMSLVHRARMKLRDRLADLAVEHRLVLELQQ